MPCLEDGVILYKTGVTHSEIRNILCVLLANRCGGTTPLRSYVGEGDMYVWYGYDVGDNIIIR